MAEVLKAHVVSDDQPVAVLEVAAAFEKMTETEKLYAHWLSVGSWHGALICLEQTSKEAPTVFALFQSLFATAPSVEAWKAKALVSPPGAMAVTDLDVRRLPALRPVGPCQFKVGDADRQAAVAARRRLMCEQAGGRFRHR